VNAEWTTLVILTTMLRARWSELRRDDAGYSTEAIILIAILAALALAVGGIIVAKITAKANSIPTG